MGLAASAIAAARRYFVVENIALERQRASQIYTITIELRHVNILVKTKILYLQTQIRHYSQNYQLNFQSISET